MKTFSRILLIDPRQIDNCALERDCGPYRRLKKLYDLADHSRYALATDAWNADVILVPIQGGSLGPFFERVVNCDRLRPFLSKLVVYSTEDQQFPALPGMYASPYPTKIPKGWIEGAHFLSDHMHCFGFSPGPWEERDLLFSFVGSSTTHPIRKSVVSLKHERSVVLDVSPSTQGKHWWQSSDLEPFHKYYRETMLRSKFALCPRGIGASSYRIYEALEAGTVPVIISDRLTLPVGPTWENCCIRVSERDVKQIPSILAKCETDAKQMSVNARDTHDRFFSTRKSFETIVNSAMRIVEHHHHALLTRRLVLASAWIRPLYIRKKIRFIIENLRKTRCPCKSTEGDL